MSIHPVVLAGGRGTRLWPLSRADKPKQFLPIHGEHSLFQRAILRHRTMEEVGTPWVVCGVADRFQVDDALSAIGVEGVRVVLEPASRNTAPAIAAAAAAIAHEDPHAILLVLPSDHLIDADAGYFAALGGAFAAAERGAMVTFGVLPTYPETGYGYIMAGGGAGADRVRPVERFVEKPPLEDAAAMVADGRHYWNAGVFAFSARALLDELARSAPKVVEAAVLSVEAASRSADTLWLAEAPYERSPDISIDYALFEHTDKAEVAPLSCRWSDIGSWRAYWDTLDKDARGNAVRGRGLAVDSANALIVSERIDVVALGVNDLAVVAAADAILVCPLERAQDVKSVVAALRKNQRDDLLDVSPTVNRPWGGYTSVMQGPRFQVKHLFVLPGKKLSLQKHHHRAEHWVVVRGTAEVTIDETVQTLTENQSTYIPQGAVHRLANPGRIMLEVIEVQTGSYLGEDDIVRLQDEWGRM